MLTSQPDLGNSSLSFPHDSWLRPAATGPIMKSAAENICGQGTVAQACPPGAHEWRQDGQELKVILRYRVNLKLAWVT